MRPRLSDAAFFWSQDRKQPLAARLPALDAVTFQAKLGSIGDKVRRVATLAGEIALLIDADRAQGRARRAARQVRPAVVDGRRVPGAAGHHGPLLRGRRRRARRSRRPRSTSTICRAAPAARCRAPAPASPWRWPTSSTRWPASSPSARSRAAPRIRSACGAPPSASLRILVEKKLDLDLRALVTRALCSCSRCRTPTVGRELWDYMVERLRAYFLDAAAPAASPASPPRCSTRCAPSSPVSPLDFARAARGAGEVPRAARSREPHGGQQAHLQHPQEGATGRRRRHGRRRALREPAEKALHEALAAHRRRTSSARSRKRDYSAALARLATLRPAVDGFFDGVMVNAEDPALRRNRLALLAQLRAAVHAHRGSVLPAGLTTARTCSCSAPCCSTCS